MNYIVSTIKRTLRLLLKLPTKILGKLVTFTLLANKGVLLFFVHPDYFNLRNGTILYYNDPERAKIFDLVKKVKNQINMQLGYNEAYQIFMAVKKISKIKGDIAEVGVYQGGSAKIICEAKRNKSLHLFDTFEGLPEVTAKDSPWFHKGQYKSSLENVKDYLKGYKHVYFYPGHFPSTGSSIKNKKFTFVHLDVDIFKSTIDCLKFFYPKMSRGGCIISHDYVSSRGVRKAFDEFFQDKPEPIIELSGSQCLVIKLENK